MNLKYKECPVCHGALVFKNVSSFDSDGSKLGFRLHCKLCDWFDDDRFYSKEDVKRIAKVKSKSILEVE